MAEAERYKKAQQQQQQIEQQQVQSTVGLLPSVEQATTPTVVVARNREVDEVTVVTRDDILVRQSRRTSDNDHDGDDDDSLFAKLPSTQRMMAMANNAMEKGESDDNIDDSQITTLEDSVRPNTVLRYGLLDFVPLSATTIPIIDMSRLEGSDFDDDNKVK